MPGENRKQSKKEKLPAVIMTGVYMFPNGDKYEGEWIQTELGSVERQGKGTHTTPTGVIYTGTWESDKMNGQGKFVNPSRATYEGEFVNNMFHGNGIYTWPNGSSYHGEFVENRMEGYGEFKDTEGQVWTGQFMYKAAPGLKFKLCMD